MVKWGTYSIIVALLAMLLPFILKAFEVASISSHPVFPLLALIFGGLGITIHLVFAIKMNNLNGSTLLLLISILTIIFGFSLSALGIPNTKYILLSGVILVAVWIMIPNKKQQE